VSDSVQLPEAYLDLLDGPNTAVLATLLADGSPQVSPIWFIRQGQEIHLSARKGRHKHRHVEANPRVSLTIVDPTNVHRYIELRSVAEVKDDPTCATRDAVTAKHGLNGADFDPPGTERITLVLRPTRIVEH